MVLYITVVHAWQLAFFPEEAQAEVWDKNLDAIIASSFAPLKNEINSCRWWIHS